MILAPVHRFYKTFRPLCYFFLIDLFIMSLQAAFSPLSLQETLNIDLYAHHLSWGYINTPPLIALWIHTGESLLGLNLLGSRFMSVLAMFFIKIILWQLIDEPVKKKNQFAFISLIATATFLETHGFLAVAEVPCLLFSACFLLFLHRFHKYHTPLYATLLALSISALLYTNYESILLIICCLAFHPSLWKRPLLYLSLGAAILLFLPHLIWLYEHHFITLYHTLNAYTFDNPPENPFLRFWLLSQNTLFYLGIVTLPLYVYILIKNKFEDSLTLHLEIIFILFFLLFTLNYYCQNPYSLALGILGLPMLLSTYRFYILNPYFPNLLLTNFIIQAIIIIYFKFAFLSGVDAIYPNNPKSVREIQFLSEITQKNTLAFVDKPESVALAHQNLPQQPALYIATRKVTQNEYNADNYLPYQNKPVFLIAGHPFSDCDSFFFIKKIFYYKYVEQFNYLGKTECYPEKKQKFFQLQTSAHEPYYTLKALLSTPIQSNYYALTEKRTKIWVHLKSGKTIHRSKIISCSFDITDHYISNKRFTSVLHIRIPKYLLPSANIRATSVGISTDQNGIIYEPQQYFALKQ